MMLAMCMCLTINTEHVHVHEQIHVHVSLIDVHVMWLSCHIAQNWTCLPRSGQRSKPSQHMNGFRGKSRVVLLKQAVTVLSEYA